MNDDERIHQIAELIDGFSYKGMIDFAEQLSDSDDIAPRTLAADTPPADVAIWLSRWARIRLEADADAAAEIAGQS